MRLHLDEDHKSLLKFYTITIITSSLLPLIPGDLVPDSPYFRDKRNVFNVYGIKMAWFWTVLLVLGMMSTLLKNYKALRACAVRLTLASAYWYTCINFVMRPIYTYFGSCSKPTLATYSSCIAEKASGSIWSGFDISGHVFIILHSSLFLIEELKYTLSTCSSTSPRDQLFPDALSTATGSVLVVWYLMLIMTCFYFHPFLEVVSGAFLGFTFWFLVYVQLKDSPLLFPPKAAVLETSLIIFN